MRLYLANIGSEHCIAGGLARYCKNKAAAVAEAKSFCKNEGLSFCIDTMVIPVDVKMTKDGLLSFLEKVESVFVDDLGGGYIQ